MASLSEKVTEALNEARILILGSQILLGFQLNAVFRPQFTNLAAPLRWLDVGAYGLMLCAVILLIAPGSFHRLVEGGNDTARVHRMTTAFATLALGPFALCLGVDEFIVATKVLGPTLAIASGCIVAALAMIAWYVVELTRPRPRVGGETEEVVQTPMKEKIKTMSTEVRVILPGAQALLGFQFSAFLTDAFGKLSGAAQAIHFASLTSTAITVILLMAPAAYHRIATGGEDTRDVNIFGSYAMLGAMVFLGASMAGDFYVILGLVTESEPLAIVSAFVALATAFALWFLYPYFIRKHGRAIG
jgi:hypothetical protein